ncbi:MAG: DUF5723 family protein [Candidatus Syntrophosphaera sp.]
MKKSYIISILLLAVIALPATTFTSKSLLFADSFMLRAKGSDANYWNPALLNKEDRNISLPALNTAIMLGNNSFDLDFYEYFVNLEYLEEKDKERILDAIDEKIAINLASNVGIFGFTIGKMALSSSAHLAATSAISEDYLELLLYGNGMVDSTNVDSTLVFEFKKDDNYLEAQSYVDLTFGMGDIRVPLSDTIAPLRFGISGSILAGAGDIHTQEYEGAFHTSLSEGMSLNQKIRMRTGLGGIGFKSLLGVAWDPVQNLSTGVTLDNVLGFINWQMECAEYSYEVDADSIYVVDYEEDLADIFPEDYTETEIESYTTRLPMEMRLAALYRFPWVSLSTDLVKGFGNSAYVSEDPRFSFGAEFTPLEVLPIKIGFATGNDIYPWRASYGIGLKIKAVEFGFGLQSIESILPGMSSKGVALATYFNLRI